MVLRDAPQTLLILPSLSPSPPSPNPSPHHQGFPGCQCQQALLVWTPHSGPRPVWLIKGVPLPHLPHPPHPVSGAFGHLWEVLVARAGTPKLGPLDD